jgi:geranylgeranyl diphosphate synthase type 3
MKVAHKIYGVPQTINSANYVYFLAYQELLTLSGPNSVPSQTELISIITCASCALSETNNNHPPTAELINLHRGQGLELLWRDSLTCPTEEQYVDMVNGSAWLKTLTDGRRSLNHPQKPADYFESGSSF